MDKKVLIWDIDNTVFTQGSPEGEYRDSSVKEHMVPIINQLYDEGYEIQFFTARHFKHYVHTMNQLNEAGIKFHGLTCGKPSGAIYIDDKGFRFEDGCEERLLRFIREDL